MRTSATSPMMMSRRRVNQPRFFVAGFSATRSSATLPPPLLGNRSTSQGAGPAGEVYAATRCSGWDPTRSDPRDRHLPDQDRGSADRAEEPEIAPDRGDGLQHVRDGARDRHLPQGLTELAAGDAEA